MEAMDTCASSGRNTTHMDSSSDLQTTENQQPATETTQPSEDSRDQPTSCNNTDQLMSEVESGKKLVNQDQGHPHAITPPSIVDPQDNVSTEHATPCRQNTSGENVGGHATPQSSQASNQMALSSNDKVHKTSFSGPSSEEPTGTTTVAVESATEVAADAVTGVEMSAEVPQVNRTDSSVEHSRTNDNFQQEATVGHEAVGDEAEEDVDQVKDVTADEYVPNQERASFYVDGAKYWEGIEPTVEGMLGGFAEISEIEASASRRFLREFCEKKQNATGTGRALDCGAGIGRVTKMTLAHIFQEVDLLEQNRQFLDNADAYLGDDYKQKVGKKICAGLQSFTPEPQRYDVIWLQWVTGHLTDGDFVDFLKRAVNGLKPNGLICVKDNLSSSSVEMDNRDSSVTRPRSLLLDIFRRADMRLVGERKQIRFPRGLYEVKMFALKPKRSSSEA